MAQKSSSDFGIFCAASLGFCNLSNAPGWCSSISKFAYVVSDSLEDAQVDLPSQQILTIIIVLYALFDQGKIPYICRVWDGKDPECDASPYSMRLKLRVIRS